VSTSSQAAAAPSSRPGEKRSRGLTLSNLVKPGVAVRAAKTTTMRRAARRIPPDEPLDSHGARFTLSEVTAHADHGRVKLTGSYTRQLAGQGLLWIDLRIVNSIPSWLAGPIPRWHEVQSLLRGRCTILGRP